jgi:hypothetical protein
VGKARTISDRRNELNRKLEELKLKEQIQENREKLRAMKKKK